MGENKVTDSQIGGRVRQTNENGGSNRFERGSAAGLDQRTAKQGQMSFLGMRATGTFAIMAGAVVLIAYIIYLAVEGR